MASSNIYMRLVLLTGPVIGEGLLHGWETSIELKAFNFDGQYTRKREAGLGLASLAAMIGLTGAPNFTMRSMTFSKRFDVASSAMHLAVDHKVPILTAAITVLHMMPNKIPPHTPGVVVNTQGGHLTKVDLKLGNDGKMAELTETYNMQFDMIEMLYLKPVNGQPIPTAPFFHKNPVTSVV